MIRHNFKSPVANERGYTLLLVIFAIVLFTILGLSIFTITGNTMKTSSSERNDQAIFYIAESALVETKAKVVNAVKAAAATTISEYNRLPDKEKHTYDFNGKFFSYVDSFVFNEVQKSTSTEQYYPFESTEPFEQHFGKTPTAQYSVFPEFNGAQITFTIHSIGRFTDGGSERKLSQIVKVTPPPPIPGSGPITNPNPNPGAKPPGIDFSSINLVTQTIPHFGNWKFETEHLVFSDFGKSNDPTINYLNEEFKYHKKVCEGGAPKSDASYKIHSLGDTKKGNDHNVPNYNVDTIYIHGNVSLDKNYLIVNSKKAVNVVICGDINSTDANSSGIKGNPSKYLNLFITGDSNDFNNVGIESNLLFAPNLDMNHAGKVDICSTIFVKGFSGNGGGPGKVFSKSCSKDPLVEIPTTVSPPAPPTFNEGDLYIKEESLIEV